MTLASLVLDATIALALAVLGWRVVRSRDLHRAIVLFVAFGFVSALAWARLGAADVALVEASVGAGLSGALFVAAIPWASRSARSTPSSARARGPISAVLAIAIAIFVGSLLVGMAEGEGLTDAVHANLDSAGVAQPITAVLLNFRGYDTLLEISVLVAAVAVVGNLRGRTRIAEGAPSLLAGLADLLLPISVLFSGYLLWRGAYGPGGAFQAGAVLAGGGVVLVLAGRIRALHTSSAPVRVLLAVGPSAFLVLALEPLFRGRPLLTYETESAASSILAIEATLMVTIAVVLLTFFPGIEEEASEP